MKTFAALLVGCWLLSGMAARAETIDFSTTTCKQFLESHKNEIGVIVREGGRPSKHRFRFSWGDRSTDRGYWVTRLRG